MYLDDIDSDGPTYRCPCGAVGKARTWSWYGWCRETSGETPANPRECRYCAMPLDGRHEIKGYPCGDCGRDVCEPGTDYCKSCNAAHDAAEQADPLHHHVWQSASDFELTVREITRGQLAAIAKAGAACAP